LADLAVHETAQGRADRQVLARRDGLEVLEEIPLYTEGVDVEL